MAIKNIKQTCQVCGGDGIDRQRTNPILSIPCTACKGVGYINFGTIDIEELDSLEDKLEDLQNSVNDSLNKLDDILEKLNE